jgi:ATP phosphoribosyltransferase
MEKLKLGIPKGSLQDSTVKWFAKAGYNITITERSYYPAIDDEEIEVMLVRPQEMANPYIQRGVLDAGLTGEDWIRERKSDVVEVAELIYSKQRSMPARWVLAVKSDSSILSIEDLNGKTISTELVEVTRSYLAENGVQAKVEFSYGATEAKVPYLVDAIVELTETGSSLRANDLRIVDTVMVSTTKLIANKESWKSSWKRKKLENLAMLLEGALVAESKVGLKMNVSDENLDTLLKILPSMRAPTVSPELKREGALDIIEYPLNKVIP